MQTNQDNIILFYLKFAPICYQRVATSTTEPAFLDCYLHSAVPDPQPLVAVDVQDKVNISVAIIPMAEDFGWSSTVSGLVQSSFFFGYMLTQVPGGYIIAKKGGRKILPLGVGLWSLATAAVPVMAGSMPGRVMNPALIE